MSSLLHHIRFSGGTSGRYVLRPLSNKESAEEGAQVLLDELRTHDPEKPRPAFLCATSSGSCAGSFLPSSTGKTMARLREESRREPSPLPCVLDWADV